MAAVLLWARVLRFWRRLSAPALSVASFALLIAVGTAGLFAIDGFHAKEPLGFVDSWFTMTSAVCVTGLNVIDPGSQLTFAGELWVLLFIQLGGLGIITLGTLIIGALGARLSLRSEMLTMMPVGGRHRPAVWQIALNVLRFSLVVEGVGVLVLWAAWAGEHSMWDALWFAVFHAVSAYCNAGFSLFPDNLIGESALVQVVISLLIIVGGLGYLTFEEIDRWRRHRRRSDVGHRLSSHTWAVLVTTTVLLLTGWILFAFFEWHGVLADMSLGEALTSAWFMSVTPRTAGFNSIDYALIGNDTAALTMMLMFVGGSPGSTAGGIKTTTLAVLFALGASRIRGLKFVGLKDRTIPPGTIERTVGIILLAMLVLTVAFFLLNAIQSIGMTSTASQGLFLPIAFETVSAFSTTGLSMSYTPHLRPSGEIIVIWLMFVGRVGLLSFFTAALLRRGHIAHARPAQEDVMVG